MGDDVHRPGRDDNLTGVGTPRSADDGLPAEGGLAGGETEPAIETGATTPSDPSAPADRAINRSGSGGSGGAPGDEGSSGETLEEMLGETRDRDG